MWRWGRLRACGTPSASSPLRAVPYGSRKLQAARQGRGRASRSCLYRLAGCCCALVLIALIWPHQVPNHKLLAISELNDMWSRGRRKTYFRCVCSSGRTRFFVRSRSRQRPDTASGECCPHCCPGPWGVSGSASDRVSERRDTTNQLAMNHTSNIQVRVPRGAAQGLRAVDSMHTCHARSR